MWFVQQFDSFLNLGICKEYPKMARSKSTSGSKSKLTNTNNEINTGSPANIPDVKAVAGTTPAEAASETRKVTPEPRKLEMVKTEPRKNVVPINRAPSNLPINMEDEIRRRAYE